MLFDSAAAVFSSWTNIYRVVHVYEDIPPKMRRYGVGKISLSLSHMYTVTSSYLLLELASESQSIFDSSDMLLGRDGVRAVASDAATWPALGRALVLPPVTAASVKALRVRRA